MINYKGLFDQHKFSLLAVTMVAVAGCSSSGSSPQPIVEGSVGSSEAGSGQEVTYATLTSGDISEGDSFSLDTLIIKGTQTEEDDVEKIDLTTGPTLGAGATITLLETAENGDLRIRLEDPDNGVDVTLTQDFNFENDIRFTNNDGGFSQLLVLSRGNALIPSDGLNYSQFGFWVVPDGSSDSFEEGFEAGFFGGGYATLDNDMPDTGTAKFSGVAQGFSIAPDTTAVDVIGNARMSVDFAAGSLNGTLSDMSSGSWEEQNGNLEWNEVTFSGDIKGNAFKTAASVTSAPNNAAALDSDAKGSLDGRFYGPQAAEATGTWVLEDSQGGTAFGGFGVKQ